jgi:phosphohistidine phosphatase
MTTGNGEVFRLHLLRHAHAAWPAAGRRDYDRILDERGRAEAFDIARQARLADIQPEKIISSPALRCHETTAIFLQTAGVAAANYDEQLYSEGMEHYLQQIDQNRDAGSLMLVGHNPMIEGLATMLTSAGAIAERLASGYPTAGLLTLEFDRPLPPALFHKGRAVHLIVPDLT